MGRARSVRGVALAVGLRVAAIAPALGASVVLVAPAGAGVVCGGGGTSGTPSPSATPLRAYGGVFHAPGRVAAAPDGTLYVTDPETGRIFVRDRYGRLRAVVEGFDSPLGIAVDGIGRIYVGELGTGSIALFDQHWKPLGQLGRGTGEFVIPNDIAIDSAGRIYVADSGDHTVKVYDSPGPVAPYVFGGRGSGAGQFDFPSGIYVADTSGELFVTDQNNYRVQVFDQLGTYKRCFGRNGSGPGKFGRIQGITGDGQGRLYVVDAFQGTVQVLDRFGNFVRFIGQFGEDAGQLRTPMGLVIDRYNRLFVTSVNNARVEVFGLDGYVEPSLVPAVVDIDPDTLNRSSNRQWITAYIEIRDYPLDQVDLATVNAYGVFASPSPVAIGDYDGDGIPDLMVKFDAQALLDKLADGQALIVVTGEFMDGAGFEGSDTVRVIDRGGRGK